MLAAAEDEDEAKRDAGLQTEARTKVIHTRCWPEHLSMQRDAGWMVEAR